MRKLKVGLIAGAFALGCGGVLAANTNMPPITDADTAKLKAEKEAAKEAQAKMTPEEKAAAKKAKQKQLSHTEKVVNPNAPARGEAISKSAKETKSHPKALPDTQSSQEALKAQEKKSPGQ